MKKYRDIETPWIDTREAAAYMKRDYRFTLESFKDGKIRHIRNGKKYLTRIDWVEDYLLSLEKAEKAEKVKIAEKFEEIELLGKTVKNLNRQGISVNTLCSIIKEASK